MPSLQPLYTLTQIPEFHEIITNQNLGVNLKNITINTTKTKIAKQKNAVNEEN